ncbi:MAG: radical SAM family heme chaperone HemW [Chlorobi bacterium]|nr:radical SAM family heme chaperone HemW [Chlorobiota bacterium]
MNEIGIYIHIPFCDHKCVYCDFYSVITTKNSGLFLQSLKREIEHYAEKYSELKKIKTIFFGGGTPSLTSPKFIDEIILSLKKNFTIDENIEITMETNPGTVNSVKLKEFRTIGINRLSVGVQSFDDDDLKFLTRIHDRTTAIRTVEEAVESDFNNISIDLIFNLPGQTKAKWKENLNVAASLPVKHISAYSLILERGTILNKMVLDGKVKISGEETDAELYEETIDFLTAKDFTQYEVSNFAKENYKCEHNLIYWKRGEYLGFGPSAHSFVGGRRWWNFSALSFYNKSVQTKRNAMRNSETLTDEEMREEFIMLNIRGEGLSRSEYLRNFDGGFFKKKNSYIKNLIDKDFILRDDDVLRLTKKGYLLCDEIIAELLT